MRAYSNDLRLRVIADKKEGITSSSVAEKYSVSLSWVNDLWRRFRLTGSYEAKQAGGQKPLILKDREAEIRSLVEETPDITLKELAEALNFSGSLQTISNALQRLGFSFKKNTSSFRTRASGCQSSS